MLRIKSLFHPIEADKIVSVGMVDAHRLTMKKLQAFSILLRRSQDYYQG